MVVKYLECTVATLKSGIWLKVKRSRCPRTLSGSTEMVQTIPRRPRNNEVRIEEKVLKRKKGRKKTTLHTLQTTMTVFIVQRKD